MLKMILVPLLAAILGALPALAGERPRLMQIPLDMPLEAELDGEYLEGIYQEKLAGELADSVLIEAPIARIESTFSEDRKLQIWFTSIEDGRRAYWLRLSQSFPQAQPKASQELLDDFSARYGKPDLTLGKIGAEPGPIILLRIDPNLAEPRKAEARRALEERLRAEEKSLSAFWQMDMRQRARLLGPDFRGAILNFVDESGKTRSMTLELLDLASARSVLNLALE